MIQTLFGSLPEGEQPPAEQEEKRGLFHRMKQAVTRTREGLSDRIESVLALTREVDEKTLEELETVLLMSDLGVGTTDQILNALRDKAKRGGIADGQELKALLKSEIKAILDTPANDRPPVQPPATPPEVILLVGVNGTGKTTTSGKLAAYFQSKDRSVLLCAADTFRAAAIEQLEVWATRSDVEIVRTKQGGDPSAAIFDALKAATARKTSVVLVDTAGRLHTKTGLMDELAKMRRTTERLVPGAPHQVLLTIDATTGQNGLEQARMFGASAGVTGIVLTKLDGTARGGIAVAIARELNVPVRYVGIGERLEDLLEFDSQAFVDALLD